MERSAFMEDFGQKVDLTQRIRELLIHYPEGTTILKELIQNADDAGATLLRFCIDSRHHATSSLISPSLSEFQGPALLSSNNVAFTDEDFHSISRIGQSIKTNQSGKTGRFGIGFNSVYHLSELPTFVSRNYVVFFDPQCKFLPTVSSSNPGKRIDFVRSAALRHYHDQFKPYCAFGCDMVSEYSGTLFRFPLRTVTQASASRLSKQSYTPADMSKLLRELYNEAVEVMLFLKNVEVIEFYEWDDEDAGPRLVYSCEARVTDSETRKHRQEFLRLAKQVSFGEERVEIPEQRDVFRLDIATKAFQGVDSGKESVSSFIISQVMGSSTSKLGTLARNAFKSYGMRLLPWASVAARLSGMQTSEGRAFCFLPLPLKTGLSFHVNGYFELSANRRDIWYGSDMDRMGKVRSDWNQCLLEEVGASCVCQLLAEARRLRAGAAYYSLWPLDDVGEPWRGMVVGFYRNMSALPLLHTLAGGKGGKGGWLSARQAVFHDEEYEQTEELAEALVADGLPLTRLPKRLMEMILKHAVGEFKTVTPSLVRSLLQRASLQAPVRSVYTVLDYCLSDLLDEEAAGSLRGLPLVPLQNQSFGRFGVGEKDAYYLCTAMESDLFQEIREKLIDQSLPESLKLRLKSIASHAQSNIRLVDDTSLDSILHLLLPPEWENCSQVLWQPGRGKQPSREWLTLFWSYLSAEQRDLSKLQKWPLVPTTTGFLKSPVGVQGMLEGGKLSKKLEGLLARLGCAFLDPDLRLQHAQLLKSVLDPTSVQLLDALSFSPEPRTSFESVTATERRELRSYLCEMCWSNRSQLNEKRLETFKSLPIFEAYNDGQTGEFVFVSLKSVVKYLPPTGVEEKLLGADCLHATDVRESNVLTQLLGVARLSRAVFYRRRVFSRLHDIPAGFRDTVMVQILRELPQLSIEDASFVDILKQVPFVPNGAGELKSPKNLYDSENLELVSLLDDEKFFPSGDYSSPDVLQSLRSLGLRTAILSDTVLASARSVEALLATDQTKATERGRVLLSYLDRNGSRWLPASQETGLNWILSKATSRLQATDSGLSKFWSELTSICWCPVLVQPPYAHMPWPAVSKPLAPPRLVRLQSDMWLVSATMRILDGDCDSPGVCQRLGWLSRLGGNILAAQLLELGQGGGGVHDDQRAKFLATTIPRVYSLLSDMLRTDEMEIVKAILEARSWIWVGSCFATTSQVVFDGPSHLAPYLHVVPADMVAFRELFLELGVKESLEPESYVSILSVIAEEKDGAGLDPRELASVVWIVHHLADTGKKLSDIMVPDWDGVLLPSSQLLYNDAPWLVASKDAASGLSNRRLVHAKISNDVAEKIGVASVRKSLLAESADFMELGLHDGMEAFGQSESLTNRLKHIVEMYTDGPGILFELLQNADDAGASEVSFLLDETSFGTSSVLSRQMADWQGAALYCYNNSVFKPEDLRAISRIGQDSKLDKPSAIGRFGLGFNSVYHFTDVPGFVSGTNIVLLDPHAANLPGVTLSQPGLKINFVGKGLLKQFPDQFEPFLHFGCDLQRPFQGTLFRFPLRTATTAARSEIKHESYSPEDVTSLFSALRGSAEGALLFLRNVKSVTVHVRKNMQTDMEEIFRIQKETVDYNERELYSFLSGTRQDEQFLKRLERTPDKQLPWSCGKIKLTIKTPGEHRLSSWIISTSIGGEQAKEFTLSNRSRGFVPWAGVAAKVTEDDHPVKENGLRLLVEEEASSSLLEGRGFCFLPLPISTGLSVHVNGYFELSANRRELWYGSDMVGGGKLRSEWNVVLLRDAAAPAYAQLLHRAACEIGPCGSFYSLFPTRSISEPWKQLSLQVYRSIVDLELPVLYTSTRGGRWISAKQAVFPDFTFPEMNKLGSALVEVGLPLVASPVHVVEMFREANSSLRFFSPRLLRKLLVSSRRTFEKEIGCLALEYCMSNVEIPGDDELQLYGLSLVPMMDSSVGTLNSKVAGARIILAEEEEQELLKDLCAQMLADVESGSSVFTSLKKLALHGASNVRVMSASVLRELLPVLLPPEWKGKEQVVWRPREQSHPTLEWMERLWSYLADHCDDLSEFSSWPLLPSSDGSQLRSVTGGAALADDGWSESLVSVFQKSGCFLVKKDVPVKLREFVQEATALGVLLAMLSAAGGNMKMVPTLLRDCSPGEVRELRRFLFQSKWFITSGEVDSVQLQILKMLRLFQCSTDEFICIAESKELLAPDGVEKQLLGDTFILAEPGKEEQILETFFGLRKVTRSEYYESYFPDCLAQLPPEDRMQAFQRSLQDYTLVHGSSLGSVSRLEFVPTRSGAIEAPERLYDPRVTELQTLLSKEAFFPSEEFHSRQLLDVLVYFGLRRSLGQQGLLDSARSVAMLKDTDDGEASRRGTAVLAHMNTVLETLEEGSLDDRFWTELSAVSWCPVLKTSPEPLLPWLPDQQSSVCSPKLVRPAADAWLVSGGMRILNGDCSELLSEKLGWKETPKATVLANQLVQLSNIYRKLEQRSKGLNLEETAATVSSSVTRIYELLTTFLGSHEDVLIIQTMLDRHAWIWTGEAFVAAKDVAFDTPAHFHPYLHVVPMELFPFKELLTSLGVRETFAASDYVKVLGRLASDTKGEALNSEQLTFVLRLLEALGEALQGAADRFVYESILMPDTSCYLVPAKRLAYNDAPWLITSSTVRAQRLVHPDVDSDLARQLGAVSLRYLSVVDQEMTSSLPCLGMEKIMDILGRFDAGGFLLYDLLEMADCLQAQKVHFLFDNVHHPAQSLLQPNLSEFQGPALVVAFEKASLTTEQICSLHSSPPVKALAQTCRYGAGLFGVYQLTDLLLAVSSGCLYMFDPCGRVLSPTLADGDRGPSGSPTGKAYSLQGTGLVERFSDQFHPFNISERLSLDSPSVTFFRVPLRARVDGSEVTKLFTSFRKLAANCLLFLKSVREVTVSERSSDEPLHELFSVSVGSSFAALRHPFHEKSWRKFQLSNFFGSSSGATKTHTIDVFLKEEESSQIKVFKWLVVQTLGSGHTRDMALDRRYLHYQLTPIAGVAACVSADSSPSESCILSPLPVPLEFELPVTIFGNFLPLTVGGRHFFLESLGEHSVKLGMLGSHAGPSLSDEIIRATWNRQLLSCVADSYVDLLHELHRSNVSTANTYTLWPKSSSSSSRSEPASSPSNDARCLVKWLVRPMYRKLGDMSLWQLHGGRMATFSEGLFVAPASEGVSPSPSVATFLKSHYPILTAPWELGKEVEEATGKPMKQLTSKTLRSLIKTPSVGAVAQSLTTQIDLLEYCCADLAVPDSSSPDININRSALVDLKGVPCPTAHELVVVKLGTIEVWIASREQQLLLPALSKKFLHPLCLERPSLAALFHSKDFQSQMYVKPFSPEVLAANIWTALPRDWARNASPWVVWSEEDSPSPAWLHSFWTCMEAFSSAEALHLFDNCPLIPAHKGPTSILVRVSNRKQVFVLPEEEQAGGRYPWLVPVLGKLGIPVFNVEFSNSHVFQRCFGLEERLSLLQSLVSILTSLQSSSSWSPSVLSPEDCQHLFGCLAEAAAEDYEALSSELTERDLELLRSLPIYQTVRGSYTAVDESLHFFVPPGAFMQPDDELRLPYMSAESGGKLYQLLKIPELQDHELLVRCALPCYGSLSSGERENVLAYIYEDWSILRAEGSVINALRSTKFVANETSGELYTAGELVDPGVPILKQIFVGEQWRFPGRQFATQGWLQILRAVGLGSTKDPALILECARKVEELGRQDLSSFSLLTSSNASGISDAVCSIAVSLTEELLNNISVVFDKRFCDELSGIEFVPAERGIPIAAGGTPTRVLASYSQASLLKDWHLCWTCCPLLTLESVVPATFSWRSLHLRSPPSMTVVMNHLQNVGQNGGEDVLSRWPNTNGSRSSEDVFGEVLAYLSSVWNELSNTDKQQLSLHAFIPVANGTRLVTAGSLYTRLAMDLAPFVFEVPRAYLSYVNMLSELGTRYEPRAIDMINILLQLQHTCGYQALNPNELQSVLSILRFICESSGAAPDPASTVLPDESGRLVTANSCAYVDAAGAHLVSRINVNMVRFVHTSVPEEICLAVGVKKLSEIILEELDEEHGLEFVDSLRGYSLSLVREQLASDAFCKAVWSLSAGDIKRPVTLTREQVSKALTAASQSLRFVKRLRTRLLLSQSRKDVTKREQETYTFVNNEKTVVLAAEPPEFISVPELLSVLVSRLCLGLTVCLPLTPLFNIPVSRVRSLEQAMQLMSTGLGETRRQGTLTTPIGAPVLAKDVKSLQFCPLRPFYAGEIVGWHREGCPSEISYGRVVEDIRAPAGQPLYRIRVETSAGGEAETLLSSNVLSFKGTGSMSSTSDFQQVTETPVPPVEEEATTTTPEAHVAEQVSAAGYVEAITDILTSLGLPPSLEKQTMLEQAIHLQEQLSMTKAALEIEKRRANAAVEEVETVKSGWSCRICLANEVNTMLIPCGHVLCQGCNSSVTRCPFCRQGVRSSHTIYRP